MSNEEISAKLVMQLRAATGLPMMKCKEALLANDSNFEKAVEWLRKKGLETAAKKADRVMKEGRVAIKSSPDGSAAAMVEVDCETEPVSGGPDFKALVDGVLALAYEKLAPTGPGEVPAEQVLAWPHAGGTVDTSVKSLVAKIGENMAVRRAAAFKGGRVVTYLHFNGKVGVLAQLDGSPSALASDAVKAFASDLGMHVAFAKPTAITRDQVAKEAVEKELEIYRDRAKQDPKMANKPPAIVEKILVGQLDKFYAGIVLNEQPWVKDDAMTVKAVLDGVSKAAGGAVSVQRVALFQVGA